MGEGEWRELKLTPQNLQPLAIHFHEEICKLWPIRVERQKMKDVATPTELESLTAKQQPFIAEAVAIWKRIVFLRYQLKIRYAESPEQKKEFDIRCRDDFIFWTNCFVTTYDPRMVNLSYIGKKGQTEWLRASIPLILFPEQEKILKQVDQCWRDSQPVLVEKSRAEGLTEILCAYTIHRWLYVPGFKAGWGSRQEKLVDELGNPDTIFARLRRIIYGLPVAMRPTTYEALDGKNDNRLRIVNPDNSNSIVGEGGDNVGRGGRSSIYFVDEAASVEHPIAVDQALSYNTDCQVDISTPRGINHFYKKRMSGLVTVLTSWWYKNPSKNPHWRTGKPPEYCAWYEYQQLTKDRVLIAQEVDIDYNASVEGVFIKPEWVKAAVGFALPPEGDAVAGFDVASAGENRSVYCMRRGPVLCRVAPSPYKTVVEATWHAVDLGEGDGITVLSYDQNSIGEDVAPIIQLSPDRAIKFRLQGIHGQSPASDKFIDAEGRTGKQKFRNRRAEIWWNLRVRFEKTYNHRNGIQAYPADQLISIPNREALIAQLSSPLMVYTASGKIGVEGKKEMRARGIPSPDEADSTAYAFADYDGEGYLVEAFDYTSAKHHYHNFNIDFQGIHGETYISLYQGEDMMTYVLCCMWYGNKKNPLLRVFHEEMFSDPIPSDVASCINDVCHIHKKHIKEWVANDTMFKDLSKGTITPWQEYRKARIYFRQLPPVDYRAEIMLMNLMFQKDMIEIHKSCERTMNQIRNWQSASAKVEKGHVFAICLRQILARLKTTGKIPRAVREQKTYNNKATWADDSYSAKNVVREVLYSRR